MKTKLLSLITTGVLLIGTSAPVFAVNDSTKTVSSEQRIEKAATDLAAETIELATEQVKQAKKTSSELKASIDERLNDTIINGKEIRQYRSSDEYLNHYNSNIQDDQFAIIEESFSLVRTISEGFIVFGIILAIIIVIGVYLNRRQKYKIIEKAIENNYPLPPGFLGKNLRPTSTTIQHIHYTQEQAQRGSIPAGAKKITKEFNVTDWANFRSGIRWCAWGVAFLLFFVIVDAPVWVFALIPIITGAGKLYTAYKLEQADKRAQEKVSSTDEDTSTTPPPFNSENNNEKQ